ncbi:MAG: putative periplasmic serine protease DO-like precursor [Pseudomonadota bacterium]|jgi:serine protease Do
MKIKKIVLPVFLFSIAASSAVGLGFFNNEKQRNETKTTYSENNLIKEVSNDLTHNNYVCKQHTGYADIVEKLLPAVVNVSISGVEEVVDNPLDQLFGRGMLNDELLNQFFGNRNSIKRQVSSLGSAFFIHEDGFLVTNYHVIKNASEITITTQDKQEFKAIVVGIDKKTDLAVLKVKGKQKFPFVKFGNSSESRIGDAVIAIGNPFNLGGTVTSGIISAKSRKVNGAYDDFIQIDASINMGNSGGPTFNIKGEVIGINTVIISNSGGNIGLGFAIASDMAKPIIEKLQKGQTIKRSMLGIMIQPVNKDVAEAVGLDKNHGALVVDVVKNSPAEKGGIQKGDIIVRFNGKDVIESYDLPNMASSTNIGEKVSVDVIRYGKKMQFTIQMSTEEDIEKLSSKASNSDKQEYKVGSVVVKNIDNETRMKMKLPDDIEGVLVVKINNDDMIESSMLNVGDVVMQVNGKKITSVKDFKDAMSEVKSTNRKKAIFHILRKNTLIINGVSIN